MQSILNVYDSFSFSILQCSIDVARKAAAAQLSDWHKAIDVISDARRDVRQIYDSPQGPFNPPAVNIGILLGDMEGACGRRTLFVSSVADGYSSMVTMLSRRIPGLHLSFSISRGTLEYPRNAITAVAQGKKVRVVYAMRDTKTWEFFESGSPLAFENPDIYNAPTKKDRLTPEIISDYLEQIGYGSLKFDFWISGEPCILMAENNFEIATQFSF